LTQGAKVTVTDGPFARGPSPASTLLREVARALDELYPERSFYGGFVVEPEPELKTLEELFRQRAASIDERVSDKLCRLVAWFAIDAMDQAAASATWRAKQDCP
jgi:hypothetical protein